MARQFTRASSQFLRRSSAVVTAYPFSVALFFKTGAATLGSSPRLFALGGASSVIYTELFIEGTGGRLRLDTYDGSLAAATHATPLSTNSGWMHAAGVWASSTSRSVFLNGAGKVTDTTPANVPSPLGFTTVGGYYDASFGESNYWDGAIAEVVVYNVALTDDEVAALAKGVSPKMIRPHAIVAYWPLYGIESPERDHWKNGLALTLFNTPTKTDHPPMFLPWKPTAVPTIAGAALAGAAALVMSASATLSASVTHELAGEAHVALSASATMSPSPRATTVKYELDGVDVTTRVRKAGVIVRDVLNDAPNTCALTFDRTPIPQTSQRLRVTINDGLTQLFAGRLQNVDDTYASDALKPELRKYPATAIDATRVNRRRPFGTFVDVSASTVATSLAATFAPGLTTAIEAGLPNVSITFDGNETFIAALVRLANLIGGYAKVEDDVISLFSEDLDQPDPVDVDHPPLNYPPVRVSRDESQLRTRVYGKGYGETVPTDVNAGETIVPITDGAQFTASGGKAITATTPDGAQHQIIEYAGVALSGGGTLVGPGSSPPTAPVVTPLAGVGIEDGVYSWAYVFVTASGKTLPSPLAAFTLGPVSAPLTPPAAGTPSSGGAMDVGSHRYYSVFRTAAGATTAGPVSNAVSPTAQAAPTAIGGASNAGGGGSSNITPNAAYGWRFTFRRSSDGAETTPSPATTITTNGFGSSVLIDLSGCSSPPPGYTRKWYRTGANDSIYKAVATSSPPETFYGFESGGFFNDGSSDATRSNAIPVVNAATNGTCQVSSIPVSPHPLVTHVDLYREFNNAGASTAKLAFSVTNGTTGFADTAANSSLGATVPLVNTAAGNRAAVTFPAGPTGTTDIELYRTEKNLSQLKLLHTVGSNTGGTFTDEFDDGSLGADAPTGDDSGLSQEDGQVNAGSTSLLLASTALFSATGGWVQLGSQFVRYTGKAGNSLTGIPASGAGALLTTVLYGQQATPAPALVGVTGLALGMLRGSAVRIWVQRDDLVAQAAQAARDGGDGIIEYLITDERRAEPSLIARCDAELAMFARPIVTVTYATRDIRTRSGKTVTVNLPSPAINEALVIQEVTISDIDVAPNTPPRFTVTASSVRFSLEDTLRRLALVQS